MTIGRGPAVGAGRAMIKTEIAMEDCDNEESSAAGSRPQEADDESELRFQRAVGCLHRLGPRVTYELLAEIGRERLLRVYIERLVDRYASLDPTASAAFEGVS